VAILRRITGRAVFGALLFAGGVAGIVYAAHCHTIDVVEVQEEEVFLSADSPFGPEPPFAAPPLFGPPLPLEDPFAGKIKAIKTTEILHLESEPKVVLEVTVGGVVLADSGRIERTYTGEEGPALCPT
jgi:hypothetical protein